MLSFSSNVFSTFFARSIPPSPPLAHTSERANSHPLSSQNWRMNSCSFSVSVSNAFKVTTIGTPNFWRFSICFSRLQIPFFSASRFSATSSVFGTPPLYFKARTVATKTTASGFNPAIRHLISINFSAPRSAPKPASVIAMSESFNAIFVARTLLHPWAILANGPPWTIAPVCSNVCTMFGLIASFNNAAIEPTALSWPAVTGLPSTS